MSDENKPEVKPEAQNTDSVPDWVRKSISEANAEAASYRQKAKTAAEEAKAEVTASFTEQLKSLSDEKSAITAERDSASSNYEKLVAALGAGVPGDTAVEFAALLQGSNADEYKAHAEKLKGMFGTGTKQKAVDRTAGFSGDVQVKPEDAFAALFQSKLTNK
jgi:hypothetical protein